MKKRKVNAVQFQKQFEEQVIGPGSLVEIALNSAETESVWIKVPFNLDDDDDYVRLVSSQTTSEDMAMVILGQHPDYSAEDQWAKVVAAGWSAKDVINWVGHEKLAAEERAKNFQYRG